MKDVSLKDFFNEFKKQDKPYSRLRVEALIVGALFIAEGFIRDNPQSICIGAGIIVAGAGFTASKSLERTHNEFERNDLRRMQRSFKQMDRNDI